ncbi:MAG: hypothetical protein JOY54_10215 [Acidobacteriaceae bacterium]|nr:hypothetical protein [Acidobacteriaceae bacterium]
MREVEQEVRASHGHPLTPAQLEKLGVRALNKYDLELECLNCGETWAPRFYPDGTLPRDFWQCPNRCNG